MIDLLIILKELFQYIWFVECIFRDFEIGEFYNVFRNEVLKCLFVIKVFKDVMEKKLYLEFYFVFLIDLMD